MQSTAETYCHCQLDSLVKLSIDRVLDDDVASRERHEAVDETPRPEVGNKDGESGEEDQAEGRLDAWSRVVDGAVRTLR